MSQTAEEILFEAETDRRLRLADMPTEQDAINTLFSAYQRLKELGWRDGIYMPKDGTKVSVIQVGSTGIFDCSYVVEWADGYFYTYDGSDVYPSQSVPPLFKPKTDK